MSSFESMMMLDILEGETSTNNKIYIAEELLENEFFKNVVQYAYDPFKMYYLKDIPFSLEQKGNLEWFQDGFDLLDRLAKRTITGNEARDIVKEFLSTKDPESADLFRRILTKDLRVGMSVKSWNKACPGLIPEFGYMRCSLPKDADFSKWDWLSGVYSQEKLDGMFVNVTCGGGRVNIHTRKGQPMDIVNFPLIFKEFRNFSGQFHGEMLVRNIITGEILDRKTGNGILISILKGGVFPNNLEPVLVLWDHVTHKDEPYYVRLDRLAQTIFYFKSAALVPTKVVYSEEEAYNHFNAVRAKGGEGTILKERRNIWKSGTSRQQVKIKAEHECELVIVGFIEGKGKYRGTLGAIHCVNEDRNLVVGVSGFTDEERDYFWNNRYRLLNKIVTVRYNEKIRDKNGKWSLFLPRYIELRHDKTRADTLEEIA